MRGGDTHLNDALDIFCTVEAQEIHWQLLHSVCPEWELLQVLFQVQSARWGWGEGDGEGWGEGGRVQT